MNYKLLYRLSFLGITGGVLMFVGDMLFYYKPVSGKAFDSLVTMGEQNIERLILGGMIGPIAGILYASAALIFYFAFKNISGFAAKLISGFWIIMFIVGGTYHAVFPNYGFVGRLPSEHRTVQTQYVFDLIHHLYLISFILGLISSLYLIYIILTKNTIFPKWIILITPTFLTLLNPILKQYYPYPFGAVLYGGWVNLCFILFFAVCFAVFYRKNKIRIIENNGIV